MIPLIPPPGCPPPGPRGFPGEEQKRRGWGREPPESHWFPPPLRLAEASSHLRDSEVVRSEAATLTGLKAGPWSVGQGLLG